MKISPQARDAKWLCDRLGVQPQLSLDQVEKELAQLHDIARANQIAGHANLGRALSLVRDASMELRAARAEASKVFAYAMAGIE